MKRALALALVVLAGAVAAFFSWPDAGDQPVRALAEGAFTPPPARTAGTGIVREGAARFHEHMCLPVLVEERNLSRISGNINRWRVNHAGRRVSPCGTVT